jgi:predicted ATPase/DNA-binding SARP family transcriptional activator
VEVGLLGPLQVHVAGADVPLSAAKVRTLLVFLLVHRGQVVSVDRIADALWDGEPPASAANLVHGYVRDLRRAVGAGVVRTVPGGYRLDGGECSVDADRFAELAAAGRYREALGLWRGPALGEWAGLPWARGVAVRLEEERFDVLERRLAADLDAGRAASVTGELAALVEEAPLRERLRALLVRALYLSGRQADALRAYLDARAVLIEQAGVEPGPELEAVEAAVLAHDPALGPPAGKRAEVPVPLTPLLGRDAELAKLRQLLAGSRLVTVTGPGGVGKTRLAVAAARDHDPGTGQVWFAELVSAATGSQVLRVVAGVLRLADSVGLRAEGIATYLRHQHGLLVLDNCEQVADAVAALASLLLARGAGLRVLVTSRGPLNVPGEQVLPLVGLAAAPAAELFAARARAANPYAALPRPAVSRIVGRLEGLPLALELAGARALSLTVEQIEAGLDEPLDLLAGEGRATDPRHRTIRAVIGWSHDLLAAPDRAAFAGLSVFAGPFTLEAARKVAGEQAPACVERLLSRCLLTRAADAAGQARYRMLEVVRQYAKEQASPVTWGQARARHLAYHAELARQLAAGLRTSESPQWADLARACTEDLRAAVRFGMEAHSPAMGSMVADLYWPWFLDGRLAELRSWTVAARQLTADRRSRARLDRVLASASVALGHIAGAGQAATRQLAIGRELGDDELIALAHNLLGMVAWARGDPAALGHHTAALRHSRRAGQPWPLVLITALAGRAAHAAGDHGRGEDLLAEAVRLAEQLGEPMVLGSALDYQAHAAFAAGAHRQAANLTTRALAAYRRIGYQEGIASAGTLAASLAALTGQHDHADHLIAQAYDACQRMGHIGGTATVLEAAALLHHQRGDRQKAIRALAAAHEQRTRSDTVVPPELSGPLSRLETQLRTVVGASEFARQWRDAPPAPATLLRPGSGPEPGQD